MELEIKDLEKFRSLVGKVIAHKIDPPPLTTIFNAHHNLVAFGIRPEFLVPSTPKNARVYMSPTTACERLKESSVFKGDREVRDFKCEKSVLEPGGYKNLPGGHLWGAPALDSCGNAAPEEIDVNAPH